GFRHPGNTRYNNECRHIFPQAGLPRASKFQDRFGSHNSHTAVYPFPNSMETDYPYPIKMISKQPN
ncbi:hypothetical protein, partial [Enterobacter roggenkampii]|uniref:hypothetical protein n=1 Tax=Enterobacter roggenkampii TaxID=1812935 RepID=UPI00197AC243